MTNEYNDVNSRKVPVQLGDLAVFHLALATADDYLQWLVKIRGERHGAVDTPIKLAHEARKIISRIMQDVDNTLAAEESSDEPNSPQAPIAKITVRESGAGHYAPDDVSVSLYAPGLPPGAHDVYCEPEAIAPYMRSEKSKTDCSMAAIDKKIKDPACLRRALERVEFGKKLEKLTPHDLVEYALAHLVTDLQLDEDAIIAELCSRIWPGWEQEPIVGEDAEKSNPAPDAGQVNYYTGIQSFEFVLGACRWPGVAPEEIGRWSMTLRPCHRCYQMLRWYPAPEGNGENSEPHRCEITAESVRRIVISMKSCLDPSHISCEQCRPTVRTGEQHGQD